MTFVSVLTEQVTVPAPAAVILAATSAATVAIDE